MAERNDESWRSLDEKLGRGPDPRFAGGEFPPGADRPPSGLSRRRFLELVGAGAALAGASCDRQPIEYIVPRVHAPEERIPGRPVFFATSVLRDGFGRGVLVSSNDGRPTKIEGNPSHPSSLGATDAIDQAAVIELYEPSRSRAVRRNGAIAPWDDFQRDLSRRVRGSGGRGLRLLTGRVTSPSLRRQIEAVLRMFPEARWSAYQAVSDENARKGSAIAYGRALAHDYRFEQADVVLSLDANFLSELPGSVRYAHDFARRRTVSGEGHRLNRLYAAEASPTITGAKADHRWPMKGGRVLAFARALAAKLGVLDPREGEPGELTGPQRRALEAVAKDLLEARGRSIVIAGVALPPAVHALAAALNEALGNLGRTVLPIQRVAVEGEGGPYRIAELAREMEAGEVSTLLILDANPAYDAPSDLAFWERMREVETTCHLGLYRDETGALATWHLPLAHSLESWGDARAHDGTAGILQPLIAPLYQGRTAAEVLALLEGRVDFDGRNQVMDTWREFAGGDFDAWWHETLVNGVAAGTASGAVEVSVRSAEVKAAVEAVAAEQRTPALELRIQPDPTVWDGRYAPLGWLQELLYAVGGLFDRGPSIELIARPLK